MEFWQRWLISFLVLEAIIYVFPFWLGASLGYFVRIFKWAYKVSRGIK